MVRLQLPAGPSGVGLSSSADLPCLPLCTPLLRSICRLGHLASQGAGTARIECVAGCTCEPHLLEGAREHQGGLFTFGEEKAKFHVTRSAGCRIRVTVLAETGKVPPVSKGGCWHAGHGRSLLVVSPHCCPLTRLHRCSVHLSRLAAGGSQGDARLPLGHARATSRRHAGMGGRV